MPIFGDRGILNYLITHSPYSRQLNLSDQYFTFETYALPVARATPPSACWWTARWPTCIARTGSATSTPPPLASSRQTSF